MNFDVIFFFAFLVVLHLSVCSLSTQEVDLSYGVQNVVCIKLNVISYGVESFCQWLFILWMKITIGIFGLFLKVDILEQVIETELIESIDI